MKKAQSKLKSFKPNERKEKAKADENNLFGPWQKSSPSQANPFANLGHSNQKNLGVGLSNKKKGE